ITRAAIRRRLAALLGAADAITPAVRAALRARLDAAPFAAPAPATGPAASRDDPPASFFAPWLGPRLKYSAALWSEGAADLAAAEEAMLALTCERARLADGQSILDLGCGWGAFALYAAARFPAARVTAVTDSPAQATFLAAAAAAQGAPGIRVVQADVRALVPAGRFDRVVAIESFEHVRNWRALLRRVGGWLEPDGRLFVQTIAARHAPSTFEPDEPGAWLARRFLRCAVLPDDGLLASFDEHLVEERRWIVGGLDYARTVDAWLERLDRAGPRGRPHARRWRLMLLVCAELFACDHGRAWRTVHSLSRPRTLR
ncbi:MAG: class I SAM-dependent methyltransferase, partial [Candidatus Eisenbacteria bacterium]